MTDAGYVHPVVCGGARWFDQLEEERPVELLSAGTYSNGVIGLHYRPDGG